jgi:hypothetical protein
MRILALLACLLFSLSTLAGVLRGRVTDMLGEPLPYATVYIDGTTIGATANGDGFYELTLQTGNYNVVCQYIGYRSASHSISVSGSETYTYNFVLQAEALDMKEVVVRAADEDPAYRVIRQAINKRQNHLDELRTFQSSIYFKGVVRSRKMPAKFMGQNLRTEELAVDSVGRGVLYLTEEEADYYTDGKREKTVIHAVRESGDKNGVGFSSFPPVISFYENNVPIMGRTSRGFISPISDNALYYYKYKLMGEFTDHGKNIYKIRVTRKRPFEPCFNGTLYISENDWAIHSLDMMLVKEAGLDMIDTLNLSQVYIPGSNGGWVIKSQVMYFTIKFMVFDVTATGVALYNNQKVNEPIADTIFAGRTTSVYDRSATKTDSAQWEQRPIPLQPDEHRDFVVKDSISRIIQSPRWRDSVRRKENKVKPIQLALVGQTYYSKEYKHSWSVNSLLLGLGADNILNYNIVEGFNIAPHVTATHKLDSSRTLVTEGAARYGFSNANFNAIGRVYYISKDRTWLNRWWLAGVDGGRYVFQYNPVNPVIPVFNTWRALTFRQNDLKIYERWEASAYLRRNYGNGLQWMLKASWQQRLPMYNTTTYSFFKGNDDGFGPNTPYTPHVAVAPWAEHKASLIYAMLSWKPGYTFTVYPEYKVANGSRWPQFTLAYRKGIPNLLFSKTDFDYWRFSVRDDMNLKLLGLLKYHFIVGGFLNDHWVSLPDLIHLQSTRGIGYAAPYMTSFQFAPYYFFSNAASTYGEAHVEYHLNGLLSNKIPFLRQARFYLLAGGNAWYSDPGHYYTEAFIGIDNIGWKLARFLRVDFVQSWDSFGGRNSGFRFGINMKAVTGSKTNLTESEW